MKLHVEEINTKDFKHFNEKYELEKQYEEKIDMLDAKWQRELDHANRVNELLKKENELTKMQA